MSSERDPQPKNPAMEQALAAAQERGPQAPRKAGEGKHIREKIGRRGDKPDPGTFVSEKPKVGGDDVKGIKPERQPSPRHQEIDRSAEYENRLIQRHELTERLIPVLQACKRVITIYQEGKEELDNDMKEELNRLSKIEKDLSEAFLGNTIMSLEQLLQVKLVIKTLALDLEWLTGFAEVMPKKENMVKLYRKSLDAISIFAAEGAVLGERDVPSNRLQQTGHLVAAVGTRVLRPELDRMLPSLNHNLGPGTPAKLKPGEKGAGFDADDKSRELGPEIDEDIRTHNERLPSREAKEAERKMEEELPAILKKIADNGEEVSVKSIRRYGGQRSLGLDNKGADRLVYNITPGEARYFIEKLETVRREALLRTTIQKLIEMADSGTNIDITEAFLVQLGGSAVSSTDEKGIDTNKPAVSQKDAVYLMEKLREKGILE